MKRIVFHYPESLDQTQDGASRVRPKKMLEGFIRLGYQVDVVAGNASERQVAIREVKRRFRQGEKYEFLYSESSTTPTLLTESHHFPTHPFLDFGFFRWFRKNAGPVGLFYRDAHWKFSQYRQTTGFYKSLVGRFFHRLDLFLYAFTVDQIFLPSLEMGKILPVGIRSKVRIGLPSGCDERALASISHSPPHVPLKLFYVGGVTPPLYDLLPLFRVIQSAGDGIHLTLCCREAEWSRVRARYKDYLGPQIEIVHDSGAQLDSHYQTSDAFIMLRAPHPYLEFAVSYKVFEAVSWGLPLLVDAHELAVMRYVKQGEWGVSVVNEAEAIAQLQAWRDNPQILLGLRAKALASVPRETWRARAERVSDNLQVL